MTDKKRLILFVVFLFLSGIGFLGFNIFSKLESRRKSKELSNIRLFTTDSTQVRVHDFLSPGKPTVVVLFNSECEHCQKEIAAIQSHRSLPIQANIFLISTENCKAIDKFIKSNDIPSSLHFFHLPSGKFSQEFGQVLFPSIYLYDKDKVLIKHFIGNTKPETISGLLKVNS